MNKEQIQKRVEELEAQRDQVLLQLGSMNGALAVYRQWLQSASDAPASEVKE